MWREGQLLPEGEGQLRPVKSPSHSPNELHVLCVVCHCDDVAVVSNAVDEGPVWQARVLGGGVRRGRGCVMAENQARSSGAVGHLKSCLGGHLRPLTFQVQPPSLLTYSRGWASSRTGPKEPEGGLQAHTLTSIHPCQWTASYPDLFSPLPMGTGSYPDLYLPLPGRSGDDTCSTSYGINLWYVE